MDVGTSIFWQVKQILLVVVCPQVVVVDDLRNFLPQLLGNLTFNLLVKVIYLLTTRVRLRKDRDTRTIL
jgi:hypothetical protein